MSNSANLAALQAVSRAQDVGFYLMALAEAMRQQPAAPCTFNSD